MQKINMMFLWVVSVLLLFSCSQKKELNRDLITAVKQGDEKKVSQLIKKGADPNAVEESETRRTPLVIAAAEGSADMAAVLIDEGANVNGKGTDGTTALMKAAKDGNLIVLKLFLDRGANVNAKDNLGQTALIKAAVSGHRDIVGILLDKEININGRDNSGHSALMKAKIHGHHYIAKILLHKGATLTDDDKKTIAQAISFNKKADELVDKGKDKLKKIVDDIVDSTGK